MKKLFTLLMFFAAKNIISQNGWSTYSTSIPSGTATSQETVIFVDNSNNKWIGFMGGGPSLICLAKYDNTSSTWTYWNRTSMSLTVPISVKAIEQDNSGNIWIGSTAGLVKYNGTNFTLYNTSNGLPNNSITSLEFSNNMLYIGTYNGLSRYDGISFTNYNIGNSLFPVSNVMDIKAENSNTLWAVSGNRLIKFYINSTFTSTSYTLSATTNTALALDKIYIDGAGMKWFVNGAGIIKYDNLNFTYFNTLYPNFIGSHFYPTDIGRGPNNGILVVTPSNVPSYTNRLVEFLPGGNYNCYYTPLNMIIGNSFEIDAAGKLWTTGSTASLTVRIHSFDPAIYNPNIGYWWSSGITSNNYKYLDINRVKAGIMNRGDMWWDLGGAGNASYEVPKGSGVHGGFAGALWIGGLDASNQLHIAGQTYRQSGNDFWPGPLDTTNATIDSAKVLNYDKIWKVDYNDINTFITQYNLGNVPLTYTPTPDIVNWPAHGKGKNSHNLAPFVDVNSDGVYDWKQGDYPKIKGDQCLYFIFNDNFSTHTETKGLPLGIEVHAMAYAYGCPTTLNGRNELAYTTFYDYKIFNRSNNNYDHVYIGLNTDVDLGNYLDDFIGSSVNEHLGFCYNADSTDETSGTFGYSQYPPAVGTTILKGPLASPGDGLDNDRDGVIDEVNEECLMNYFTYYNNIGPFTTQTSNPSTKYQFYNILQGMWKDSTHHTCGGNAYGGTTKDFFDYPWSNYVGNPCGPAPWTETTAGNIAGDRRYVVSCGPFSFFANTMTELEFAQVWSVDSAATSNRNIASVTKLISDAQKIRSFYSGTKNSCLSSINIGIKENELSSELSIYPNPANSTLNIKTENNLGRSVITITDVLGKTLMETKKDNLNNTSFTIEHLNSGVYLLNVKSEKGLIVKKFVKE